MKVEKFVIAIIWYRDMHSKIARLVPVFKIYSMKLFKTCQLFTTKVFLNFLPNPRSDNYIHFLLTQPSSYISASSDRSEPFFFSYRPFAPLAGLQSAIILRIL